MEKTIYKNFHRPLQLIPACFKPFSLCFMFNKTYSVHRCVKFTQSCSYNLGDNDQYDWNKLFGVAFGVRGIHRNSIRFGWRWNIAKQKIELCTIEYRNGIVTREYMRDCDIPLNEWVYLHIDFEMDANNKITYKFTCNGKEYSHSDIDGTDLYSFWGCGLYFGGNRRSPHRMTIEIEKL